MDFAKLNLTEIFSSVVADSDYQLCWAEPEHWFRSEIFQRIKANEAQLGCGALAMEIPYYTLIRSTGKESDQGPPYGKWIDLLLLDHSSNAFLWLELKVVHLQSYNNPIDAMKPFVNDTASLLGFQLDSTVAGWRDPPKKMRLGKVTEFINGAVERIGGAKHRFVSAVVLIHEGGSEDWALSEDVFREKILARVHNRGWVDYTQPPEDFASSVERLGVSKSGVRSTLATASWSVGL